MLENFWTLASQVIPNLPDDDVAFLNGSAIPMPPGASEAELVLASGSQDLHVLEQGWACKIVLLRDGRRQVTLIHTSGEVLDLDRLNKSNLRVHVETISPCRIVRLPLNSVRDAIETRPAIRKLFWGLTTRENLALSERVASLCRRTALESVAAVLCDLYDRSRLLGEVTEKAYVLRLSRRTLADLLGLGVVHINRSLSVLKDENLIACQRRNITILDHQALRDLAVCGVEKATFERPFIL